MERVRMEVVGLTSSPQNSGMYALILQETGGERRMSILIGQELAQSIALELEAIRPPRPITHDLMKNVLETLGATLTDVTITELREGTYYAVLQFDSTPNEVDARPSDAIALAIRFGAPIYVSEEVLAEAGMQAEEEELVDEEELEDEEEESVSSERPLTEREKLMAKLEDAVEREDYEQAAQLRDEIHRLDESNKKSA